MLNKLLKLDRNFFIPIKYIYGLRHEFRKVNEYSHRHVTRRDVLVIVSSKCVMILYTEYGKKVA